MNNFLRNITLFVLCLGYALWRGSARRGLEEPRRVCVIQTAQLGDMICTTPVFHAIKKKYPKAEVVVVGKAINEFVLSGNKDVDSFFVWQENPFTLIRKLRATPCDFGITTGPNFVGLAVLFLAGVKSIAVPRLLGGTSPLETKTYRMLRHLSHIVPHVVTGYTPREYLKLLEPLDIVTDDTTKHLSYTPEALRSVKDVLAHSTIGTRPFAIIAPGTGHWAKRWPPERFASVANYLAEKHMPVAITGSARDAEDVTAMMKNVRSPDVVNFSEQFSLDELKAFVSLSALSITADTAGLFIAETFNIPTICIAGPVDAVQPFRGPRNIVLVPPRKKAAMSMFNTMIFDADEARRQAEATTVEEVLSAVEDLLSKTTVRE